MSEASIERVRKIVAGVSTGVFPMNPTFTVGTCDRTGLPKVSCGLFAPDTRAEGGLTVQTGVKAGGIGWPAHTVVLNSHEESERTILLACREAFHSALKHEGDENLSYLGGLVVDPHPAV